MISSGVELDGVQAGIYSSHNSKYLEEVPIIVSTKQLEIIQMDSSFSLKSGNDGLRVNGILVEVRVDDL